MICVSEHELAAILGILKKHAPDCEARAFGSRYKWTSNEYSDLDLALAGKAKLGLSRLGSIRDAFEESDLPFRVDVLDWHCLSKEFQAIINNGYEVIFTPNKKRKERWRKVRLGDVAEVIGGFAFKGQDFSETYGDMRVVKITDITPPIIDYQSTAFIDSSKYDKCKLKKYLVKNKDFVVAMTGATIGKIGRLQGDHSAYINQRVAKITAIDGVDNDFIYYAISGNDFQGFINNHIDSNSVQANISATSIGNFPVSLPLLPTQRAIAATLSCLDDKIELNRRINANLEAQAQAIFKSWFVDFEPWGGKRPHDWTLGKAEDFFDISIGKTPPRKEPQWFTTNQQDVIWVSISDMGSCGTFISDSSEYLTAESISRFNVKVVPSGTVLLSFKLTIGRVAITNGKMTTNEAIAHFKHSDDTVTEYLYCYLYTFDYQALGNTSSIATAVNSKTIKAMPFVMPDDQTLQMYHKSTASYFEQIKVNLVENRILAAIRDALLPKLMSGEIEVET